MEKVKNYLIRAFYWLKLRVLLINIQRVLTGENTRRRTVLPSFNKPIDIERYINSKFKYRLDTIKILNKTIPLDWVSEPEVFQAKLINVKDYDGDCDDYHYWVATCLSRTAGVSDVMMVSIVWAGGGHTVCVYSYEKEWYLFNYRIFRIDSPNDVPSLVLERHAPESEIRFYVFEDLKFKLIAASPDTVSEPITRKG